MITVKNFGNSDVAGRLGNQIFQFAFLYGIYKRKNYSIHLPKLEKSQFWKCFDIVEPEIHTFKSDDFKSIIQEKTGCYNFDKTLIEQGDNCMYSGYFQSYFYFDEFKNDLIKTLKFKNHIIKEGDLELNKFKKNLVSVHVRRTDYLANPIWGDLIKEGYYEKAIKDIKENDDVLVFSDDVQFVKNYFKNKKNYHVIEKNEYVSLYMMTKCNKHIIANSSFSWMGAYLSGKENITCPNPWFPSIFPKPNNIQKDVTKPEWKKINVFK
jgi:hypothetical protein